MIGRLLCCALGFHDWQVLAQCTTRAVVMLGINPNGGDHRVCRRCGVEDNDMRNCHHEHVLVAR